jgi:two-component system, chemotaxis family, protein-glutamate methylesterase/glutaminase
MTTRRKTKVLVVDDSLLFREVVSDELSKDGALEIVGKAANPFEAKDLILALHPDVMILDLEMPRMNGIEFLKKLMPQYPIPVVVVVSSVSKNVFQSLNAGAVDFVSKPSGSSDGEFKRFISELNIKTKIASTAKVDAYKKTAVMQKISQLGKNAEDVLIAICASTGGTEAIFSVIRELPKNLPGIVIVQYMPPVFTKIYAERLNNSCALHVKEAQDGDVVSRGKVLIAPRDLQMKVFKEKSGYFVKCQQGEKVSGHCPSVDVLFHSVAEKAKNRAIGVILTGMGADGAKGLLEMKKVGACTLGQDEKSCVVYGMPMVAYNIGAVEEQTSLENIPSMIVEKLKKF